jgi:hypothetical protein
VSALRSRVHMLTVAAACIEQQSGNPLLVKDLRAAAEREAARLAEGTTRNRAFQEEEARVGNHRTLMAMLPDCRAVDRLKAAMLQRAYDLMWEGCCLECDALIEFLPSAAVERMFAAWEKDQTDEPKSEFYNAK